VGGRAASIATCDVLVIGSGNLDSWTMYQLAGRSHKHAALWNEHSQKRSTRCPSVPDTG
jgi:hypothetical protein